MIFFFGRLGKTTLQTPHIKLLFLMKDIYQLIQEIIIINKAVLPKEYHTPFIPIRNKLLQVKHINFEPIYTYFHSLGHNIFLGAAGLVHIILIRHI